MRKFIPHPEVAFNRASFDPAIHKTMYRYDYDKLFKQIASGEKDELMAYRFLILNDLYFLLYFILETPDDVGGNHPFIIQRCKEIQSGPLSYTLDVWARGHLKSSTLTIAESLQYILGNPEHCCCILSYKASVAKSKFLGSIKQHLEENIWLKKCFPDVVWEDPKRDAFRWSLDEGLYLKRNTKRGEASFFAGGLLEGMPTGLHFERLIFDDITTEDIGNSPGQMEEVKKKFDSAQNLGMLFGKTYQRVIGTFYHYADPLIYVRDKTNAGTDDKKYTLRLYPATEDGTPNGKSVFMNQETLNAMKNDKTFNCQQLLDPSPGDYSPLDPLLLQDIEPDDIPKGCFKFMVIDQAGDLDTNKESGDCWAVGLFSVYPFADDTGASSVYIRELIAEPLGEVEAVDMICKMYVHAGTVKQIGVEKVGMSATHNAIRKVLHESYKRKLTIETDGKKKKYNAIVILRPSGRHKNKFIDSSISWPLSNAKIYVSSEVEQKYKDKLILEMEQFPFGKTDDVLNIIAYLYDMIMNYDFPDASDSNIKYCDKRNYGRKILGWTGG